MYSDLSNCTGLSYDVFSTNAAPSARKLLGSEQWLYGHASILVGHKVFVTGGLNREHSDRKNIFSLDIKKWKWTVVEFRSSLPVLSFEDKFVALINDMLLLCVRDESYRAAFQLHPRYRLWRLDLTLCTLERCWSEGEDIMPYAKSSAEYIEARGMVVVFGGKISDGRTAAATNRLVAYDIKQNAWREIHAKGLAPPPLYGHCSCVRGKFDVFYYGGVARGNYSYGTSGKHIYRLWCAPGEVAWRKPINTFSASGFTSGALCCAGSRLIIYGGFGVLQTANPLIVLDLDKGAGLEFDSSGKRRWFVDWQVLDDASQSLSSKRSLLAKAFGSKEHDSGRSLDLEIFAESPHIPYRKSGHSAVVSHRRMIVLGGTEASALDVTILDAR